MKTNKRSRVISLLLCLVMMLGTLHTVAFAASEKPATRMVTQTLVPEEDDLPDGDMLFAGYLERQLYPEASDGVSLFGISAGDMLNEGGLEKAVYDDLKPKIEKVADGTISSTKFTVEADISALKWTKEQLGCEIVSGGSITEAAKNAVAEKFSSMLNTTTVLHALLADCPYELYWFDKTTGIKIGYETSGTSEEIEIKNLTLSFSVSGAYAGSADYTADTTKTGAAKSAVANAKEIVEANKDKSDRDKLEAYKNKICDLVSYNNGAAADESTPYGDPWQLIYVFDNDLNTNVVCEGYSKAFQYLCDLSDFTDGTTCFTVSGTMTGGTGAGRHMWNIVNIKTQNYLVDVTNCDAGTVGAPNNLFMKQVAGIDGGKKHTFTVSSTNVVYTYDEDQNGLFCNGYLKLDPLSETRDYKYTGLSLDKVYDGQPVKLSLTNVLATDNGLVNQSVSESGLYGKYVIADYYLLQNGGWVKLGFLYDGWTELVGPKDPGSYKIVFRSAFEGEQNFHFFSLYFTIAASCEHTMTKIEAKAATCTDTGNNEYYYCTKCKKYYKELAGTTETTVEAEVISAKGHSYGSLIAEVPATHTTAGTKAHYECSVCNKLFDTAKNETTAEKLVLAIIPHEYGEDWKSDGINHWKECTCGDQKDVATHSFAWKIDTPATEETTGIQHEECTVCGYKRNENTTIPKLDHTHKWVETPAKASTCTEQGNNQYFFCSKCNKYYKADKVTETSVAAETLPLANHNYGSLIAEVPATHTTAGTKAHYKCSVCNKLFDTAKNETTAEALVIAIISHSYDGWKYNNDNHWKECGCGNIAEQAAHTYGAWTVTKPATETEKGMQERTCTVCSFKENAEIPMLDHTHKYGTEWKFSANGHWHECTICHEQKDVAIHSYTDESDTTCNICGYERMVYDITAGDNQNYTVTVDSNVTITCNGDFSKFQGVQVDGELVDPSNYTAVSGSTVLTLKSDYLKTLVAGNHIVTFVYEDGIATADLTVVEVPAHEHSYDTDWKSDADNHWHACSCGDKKDAAAHSFKWVTDEAATATQKGSKHEECKVCGYKKAAVEIPETGTPTDPSKPEDPDSPQTGDNGMMPLWVALLFVSGAGVAGATLYSRKKKTRNNNKDHAAV